MKATNFMDLLIERYPQLISKDAHKSDIRELIEQFSETNIEKIWDRFIDHHEKHTPPLRATFSRIAWEIGLGRKSNYVAYFKCLKCQSYFTLNSSGCPKCKEQIEITVFHAKKYPGDMYHVQPGCYICDKYKKGGRRGAECRDYGKTEHQQYNNKCKGCICSICCRLEYERKFNPETFKEVRELLEDLKTKKKMEEVNGGSEWNIHQEIIIKK